VIVAKDVMIIAINVEIVINAIYIVVMNVPEALNVRFARHCN
jgi:hypothetical protein